MKSDLSRNQNPQIFLKPVDSKEHAQSRVSILQKRSPKEAVKEKKLIIQGVSRPRNEKVRGRAIADYPGEPVLEEKLVNTTLLFWQPRATCVLNAHDAECIAVSCLKFFKILHAWERADVQFRKRKLKRKLLKINKLKSDVS